MGQEQDNTKERKWKQISERERYKIEALVRSGMNMSVIARQLDRNRRMIQREVVRGKVIQNVNWELRQVYCADYAQLRSGERAAKKGRGLKIGHCHGLARYLEQKIVAERYSPDAALGYLKVYGNPYGVTICTKTLYNYIDAKLFTGISNKDLPLKRKAAKRPYRRRMALNNTQGRSIEERPAHINDREEKGHWEMDCVVSGQGGKACLLVLTERTARNELIFKMKAQTQDCVAAVLDRLERRHKGKFSELFKSITVDNGSEFLCSSRLEASCRSKGTCRTTLYYAHPYSAWERGSNENANKLIRRFIPKGANIEQYTDKDIRRIERWMNSYPRRRLGYRSPDQLHAIL